MEKKTEFLRRVSQNGR